MIPRLIHQYWCNLSETDDPPADVAAVIEETAKLSHPWEHRLWNRESIGAILKSHPDLLRVFERINIPAMKSDLARILVLYEFGGLYLDASCVPRYDYSAEKFISDHAAGALIVAESSENPAILMNRLVATEAKNPHIWNILLKGFEAVSESMARGDRSIDVWSLTGCTLSDYINQHASSIEGLHRWNFEEAFALFTRVSCQYKTEPLGQWVELQSGNLIPVYGGSEVKPHSDSL